MAELTLDELKRISDRLKRYAVKPKTVLTQEQADRMTADDPAGKRWIVGEEFYEYLYSDGEVEVRPLQPR